MTLVPGNTRRKFKMGKPRFIFGNIVRDNVGLMTEPDEYAGTKAFLKKDTPVIIDPNVDTNGYYLVTVDGISGYVIKTDIIKK